MDNKSISDMQAMKNASMNKKRICMYSGCNELAIKSYVLQKNGILRQISEDNHLIELKTTSLNEVEKKGMFAFKKIGVNDAYTFSGFCARHDSLIFKPIEDENLVDFYNPLHQSLFAYRGLCQEIRRKEISIEWIDDASMKLDPFSRIQFISLQDGYKLGVKNLSFFKLRIEKTIETEDFGEFIFNTIEMDKIDLCVSVPLNIDEEEDSNPLNLSYEEWKDNLKFPFSTSFINIFPYKQKSYFIGGYHKDYPCKWTKNKINKLNYLKNKKLRKELSDFIVLRLEFWVMSPGLFKKIPPRVMEKYMQTFSKNIMSHKAKLKTDINLFESI
ncbi:hypothetical protein [Hymenobacter sp. PAMC 26628]|uniref:hypothetical protein n=1 Tax=Hymenobacter sp. PAMC 26628 TaxID=1484118 RepID=UPI000AFE7B0E|nr:hypothetical protein [Hymenobacter sp. PAMC 26628]